ncbi:MAG: hypothetical protein OIF35_05295 [Cellvibrionaceae bacterium]|nr:hypothetical protein [Cellvibrionaceae bacterium]
MKNRAILALGLVFSLSPLSAAIAQTNQSQAVDLGKVDVVEEVEADSVAAAQPDSGEGVENGSTSLSSTAIAELGRGDFDTTEIFSALPFVQMDNERRVATGKSIQSLAPANFAIAGGNYYNNNIMINGVGANSVMDVSNTNPLNANEVAGQTAQTVYLDPSLIGDIVVQDSNISAEYGEFSGGVVEMNVRQPKDEFSVTLSAAMQTDSWVDYLLDPDNRPDNSADLPEPSVFEKYKTSLSVDIPVNERFKMLAAYSRIESEVDYYLIDGYSTAPRGNGTVSENFLLKGVYAISENLEAEGQVIYTPYDSESQSAAGIDNLYVGASDGAQAYFKLSGASGDMDWETQLAYSRSDAGRTAPNINYSLPSAAPSVDWCSRRNCTRGGLGALDQEQEDWTFDVKVAQPLWQGELRYGAELSKIEAHKSRPQDVYAYSRAKIYAKLDCPSGDLGCVDDEYITGQYQLWAAYSADIKLNKRIVWAEFQREFGEFDVRAGLRYSHDDFLANDNIAPRFTASWEFLPDTRLTFGANRYFGKSMVSYAIRSQYPDRYMYRRGAVKDDNGVYQAEDWALYAHSRSTDYKQAELDTPHSDELTLALEMPTPLRGKFKIEAIKRDHKDSFARSNDTRVSFNADTGKTLFTRQYEITNEGFTDYEALSLQWQTAFDKHGFAINMTWSDTLVFAAQEDYFDEVDGSELSSDFVYYNGQVISKADVSMIESRSNFGSSFRGWMAWSARWFNDTLSTNASLHYNSTSREIADSRENISIDDEQFDVYTVQRRDDHTNVKLSAEYELFDSDSGRAVLQLKADNIFNNRPHTKISLSNPYQLGRSFWLGFSYTY